jgi:hypothetical protein
MLKCSYTKHFHSCLKTMTQRSGYAVQELNRSPVQKLIPHKSTLNSDTTTTTKKWLESTNQLGLRPQ